VSFLSEAIASNEHTLFSPLAECAILATICGRAMSHSQVSNVERAYGNASLDFWLRHEWIDGMLSKRLETLASNYPVVSAVADSMLLFAFLLAQTAVIYLADIIESLAPEQRCQPNVNEYQKRAMVAAREIARLSKAHEHIGFFKVRPVSTPHPSPRYHEWGTGLTNTSMLQAHIFLPLTIYFGASRASSTRRTRASDDIEVMTGGFQLLDTSGAENGHALGLALQACTDALRKMQSFNNLARDHLAALEGADVTADYVH